jgi:hypothetical protein
MITLLSIVTLVKKIGPTMGLTVAKVSVKLSHENGVVTVVVSLHSSWSFVDWRKF